ncbi:MAG: serine/threonine protein kinase [Myxococcales bacterium]|nr:serine/threonine protein kinase [Myxococcales bacterium]
MMEQRLGRYTLDDEIGRGGMAVVYRATDPVLERKVALKVLHPHLASREDARARFSREARAVARLQHPHIVEVFDYAPPESDRAYIVTEYIDGPTLRGFVERHPVRFPEVAALILVPVCEALGRAHEAGIVHRDVKPENIMIRPDGTPVLMDFGIAQMVDMDTLTATGTMLGSPAHMAPEVIDGARVDHRSDLFSVGTVLYWLVCGALPFTAPNPAALFRRILEGRYDPVLQRRPHAGRRVARLIEQLMALDPAERPQSASEVADGLRALLDEVGIHDVDAELEAFFGDPEVYQDGLARRLLTAYVTGARRALDAKLTGRALDFIDRALALDDQDEAARALLARVERGRRRGAVVRGAAAARCWCSPGWAWALWPDDPPPRRAARTRRRW